MEYLKKTYEEVYQKFINVNKHRKFELNIILFRPVKYIRDIETQKRLIEEFHNTPTAGHFGIRKTMLKLKQRYIWNGMRKMIKNYITNCDKCLRNKQTRYIKEEMTITTTPSNSFETIEIDTVGPLRISNGYRYILTMQCSLTKYVIAHPIETKDAKTIARTLVEQFILKYGCFKVLKSDRGTEFKNELLAEICNLLDINQYFSAPYHHQSIGSLERNHRVMNEYMLNFADSLEWDKWIPYYTFAYNTTPHIETNYSPHELIYGKLATLPTDNRDDRKVCYDIDNYAIELKLRLRKTLEIARNLTYKSKEKTKLVYDKKLNKTELDIGDLVLVKIETRKKNQSPYKGPYKIVKRLGVNSIIKIDSNEKIFHNNSLKLYKKCTVE